MSLLTKPALLRAIEEGRIVVRPLDSSQVNNCSIDLRLGEWVWRQTPVATSLNPYSETSVHAVWGEKPERCFYLSELLMHHPALKREMFAPTQPDDRILLLSPGECVLAHTEEFVGGTDRKITTKMQARSSVGRNSISVCVDAGWGDIGFFNRWTMEIQNRNPHAWTFLICGTRICQMIFLEGEEIDLADMYDKIGKYQTSDQLEDVMSSWRPEHMIPRMWRDHEIRDRAGEQIKE
tara:strand:+ start:84 stop:791 length:708 start_codon:yes stop_codon:yes gene_type:complete